MSGAYTMHEVDEKCVQNLSGNLQGRDHLGEEGMNKRKLSKWILIRFSSCKHMLVILTAKWFY
jgi:hypothetical protein